MNRSLLPGVVGSGSSPGPEPVAHAEFRRRSACRVSNDVVCLDVLERGGALARFGFVHPAGAVRNLLWEAPWMDDTLNGEDELRAKFGDVGSGRFLQNFTGHALCLDCFGPASSAEVAKGSGLHGEGTLVNWHFDALPDRVRACANLPIGGLQVERRFMLLSGESVVRIEERVTNCGPEPRCIDWVQHATVGPPGFDARSHVWTSARQGMTWPHAYEGCASLARNRAFTWPVAEDEHRNAWNLERMFAREQTGFVAALRQPAQERFGWVAALNPATCEALLYVFSAQRFPFVTMWEENRCRSQSPWFGSVQARGIEFGSAAFPLGKEGRHDEPVGWNEPVTIAPGASSLATWVMVAVKLPGGWEEISGVDVRKDEIRLQGRGGVVEVGAGGVEAFLAQSMTAGEE